MEKINVNLENNSYSIFIETGLCNTINNVLNQFNNGQEWVIFSQKYIFEKYGQQINDCLQSAGFKVQKIILSDGESAKSLLSLEKIYSQLIEFGCMRNSTFLALGGGVVGDLTGFVAATFMRGVQYVQIPTTLLAMVDSSIGGKTGVNIPQGKNLVGSIYQPIAVIIDPQFLQTLPNREIKSGMGEVIKYGAILDANLLDFLNENINNILNLSSIGIIENVIIRCVKLKAKIIIEDEFEKDIRRILNFGHTLGHALETYFNFESLRHGEAVAYGMIAAGQLSVLFSNLKEVDYNLLVVLIEKLSLPKLNKFDSNNILQIVKNDKKVKSGNIHFILLNEIGSTVIKNNIDDNTIINVLDNL